MRIPIKFIKNTLKSHNKSLKIIIWSVVRVKIKETTILKNIKVIIKLAFSFRENGIWNNENTKQNSLYVKNYQRCLVLEEKIKLQR